MNRPQKNNWDQKIYELVSVYETEGIHSFLDPETFHHLIDYYETEEQFKKALSVAQLAESHYRFSADFLARQAYVLLKMNLYSEVMQVLDKAFAITPGDFELSILRAETYIRLGESTKGLACLSSFKNEAEGENLSEVLLIESLAYERSSDFERMFYALKKALEANPENEQALERMSLCMEVCRKLEEGIEVFKWLLDQNPYAFLVWFYLAQAYAYLGQNKEAMEAYEYAFLAEPSFEEAYQEFVDLCIEQGYYEEALKAIQDISEHFDVDSDLLLRTGSCYNGLGQHETARQYLEKAARLDPHNEEVVYQLGACYAAQEKWSKAVAYYRKAVRMSPDFETYHQALAESAFEIGDYQMAETAYRNALVLAPDNHQVWLDLAWFLLEMMRPEEALQLLEEANETIALKGELKYSYCACLFANGKRQAALRYLSELLDESYEGYPCLFEWQPLLRSDNEVNALLSLYKP